MSKRLKVIYIIIALVIVCIYGAISSLLFRPSHKSTQVVPIPTTTPTLPTVSLAPLDKLKHKANTSQDSSVKNALIKQADLQTGYIYSQTSFNFYYLRNEHIFQARIISANIPTAKADVRAWLLTKGISGKDICQLPLLFYFNPRFSPNTSQTNPIPEECQ